MRTWSGRMIFGNSDSIPFISQVAISNEDLIFVLDSQGRVTIINKDLGNEENGIIFVLKKALSTKSIHVPYDIPYSLPEPVDSVSAFKRQKLLEPQGLIITLSEQ